nr:hypothetical protein Iba_chr14cCG9090 [Ipomoea batatas]
MFLSSMFSALQLLSTIEARLSQICFRERRLNVNEPSDKQVQLPQLDEEEQHQDYPNSHISEDDVNSAFGRSDQSSKTCRCPGSLNCREYSKMVQIPTGPGWIKINLDSTTIPELKEQAVVGWIKGFTHVNGSCSTDMTDRLVFWQQLKNHHRD